MTCEVTYALNCSGKDILPKTYDMVGIVSMTIVFNLGHKNPQHCYILIKSTKHALKCIINLGISLSYRFLCKAH